jgi:hypothetical protein
VYSKVRRGESEYVSLVENYTSFFFLFMKGDGRQRKAENYN